MRSPTTDPRIERLAGALGGREPARVERTPGHREAAVALVVRPRDDLEILLVRRAERESDPWSGHVGLPGGRRHAEDRDLLATALRETEEETGLALDRDEETLGWLDEVEPATPRLPPIVIAPVVGVATPDAAVEIDPRELVGSAWVPLWALRDPAAADRHVLEIDGMRAAFPAIRHGDMVVWGLTLRILRGFFEVAERVDL